MNAKDSLEYTLEILARNPKIARIRTRTLIQTDTGKKMLLGTVRERQAILTFLEDMEEENIKILKHFNVEESEKAFWYLLDHPETQELEISDIKEIITL